MIKDDDQYTHIKDDDQSNDFDHHTVLIQRKGKGTSVIKTVNK